MLGKKLKDVVSGFTGTCTGFVEYLTGCKQVLLIPQVKDDGALPRAEWFDVDRVVVIDETVVVLPQTANGSDLQAPIR